MIGVAQVNGFTVLLLNRIAQRQEPTGQSMRLALGEELVERLADPVGLNRDALAALAAVKGQKAARQQLTAPAEGGTWKVCQLPTEADKNECQYIPTYITEIPASPERANKTKMKIK